jgi:predicted negative regulator of RcsB-dependent stress response
MGDRYREALILDHLGDAYHAFAQTEQARSAWQRALTIYEELRPDEAAPVRTKLTETRHAPA